MLRVVFMGSPPFAATTLRRLAEVADVALVVTQPDKRKGRGKKIAKPAVKVVAEELGLEVFQPASARTGELAERLGATGAELAVVVAYGKILPLPVLEALPGGCLNVHASILPAYRGAAPIQWAVIDGLAETGVSIMALDEGMDTGPVYATRRVPICADDTSGSMFEKLASPGAELLVTVLADIESGTAVASPQDDSRATHARMLKKSDGEIDWTAPATVVSCRIRGVDPWPGAQAVFVDPSGKDGPTGGLEGLPLKMFGAVVTRGEGEPGEVLAVTEQGLTVACGSGAVVIGELQPAGSRRMPAIECARGRRIGPGSRLVRPSPPPTPTDDG